jgi:hypothetical protein
LPQELDGHQLERCGRSAHANTYSDTDPHSYTDPYSYTHAEPNAYSQPNAVTGNHAECAGAGSSDRR